MSDSRGGGESEVAETGGKRVYSRPEGVAGCGSDMTSTGQTVRGHLVDRMRMAMALS